MNTTDNPQHNNPARPDPARPVSEEPPACNAAPGAVKRPVRSRVRALLPPCRELRAGSSAGRQRSSPQNISHAAHCCGVVASRW